MKKGTKQYQQQYQQLRAACLAHADMLAEWLSDDGILARIDGYMTIKLSRAERSLRQACKENDR